MNSDNYGDNEDTNDNNYNDEDNYNNHDNDSYLNGPLKVVCTINMIGSENVPNLKL